MHSRYYDPEVGRFLSQDDLDYADPETINGLNLYAYSGNNPVMNFDPTGKLFLSFLIAGLVGATVSAFASIVTQKMTGGEVDWRQVGISALFSAVGGVLSFAGVGGLAGQFVLQGGLAVAELYSIAAVEGDVSSIGAGEAIGTFIFAGLLGAFTKPKAKWVKQVNDIGKAFTKYAMRDIQRYSAPVISTISRRGAKYMNVFVKKLFTDSFKENALNIGLEIGSFWLVKHFN